MVEPSAMRRRAEMALDIAIFGVAVVPVIVTGAIAAVMGLGMRATWVVAERLVDGPAQAPSGASRKIA